MNARYYLVPVCCILVSLSVLTDTKPAIPDKHLAPKEPESATARFERRYRLPMVQAEAIALTLRLEIPRDTKVKALADKNGTFLVLEAPKRVHEPIASLVALLSSERLEKQKEEHQEMLRSLEKARRRRQVK
jgi:hypothetical protein